jgi:hypothetical protein
VRIVIQPLKTFIHAFPLQERNTNDSLSLRAEKIDENRVCWQKNALSAISTGGQRDLINCGLSLFFAFCGTTIRSNPKLRPGLFGKHSQEKLDVDERPAGRPTRQAGRPRSQDATVSRSLYVP